MKKTYFTPEIQVVKMPKQMLLAGSRTLDIDDEDEIGDDWKLNTND